MRPMGSGRPDGMPPQGMGGGRPDMPQQAMGVGRPDPAGNGNGWGRAFMDQYGSPPGQMRTEWDAFRAANGVGGSAPAAGPATSPASPTPGMGGGQGGQGGNGWGQQFREQYGQAPGQMRSQWDAFRAMNGVGGGGQPQMPPQGSAIGAAAPQPGGMDYGWRRGGQQWGGNPGWGNGGQMWSRYGGRGV